MKMDQLFETLLNTLNLILLPKKVAEIPYLKSVQTQLEDLESDYYTFFHGINTEKLYEEGYISSEFKIVIGNLRKEIDLVDTSLWNSNDFIENEVWKRIRKSTLKILVENL